MKAVVLIIFATTYTSGELAATGLKITHASGPHASQKLDSYSSPGSGYPILIYTHGGSWHSGSKDNKVENKKNGLIAGRTGYNEPFTGLLNEEGQLR